MHIFRLPAHLNAFRGNVLDISSRFQFLPFSIPIRPHRAVPPCSPLPVPPCLASSRSPSRFIPLVWRLVPSRPALLTAYLPRLTSSRLPCRSIVPPLSSPRLPCRGAERGTELVVAIRCVRCPLPVSVAFQSACQARPVHRVVVRGGRREGAVLPMPSARLCGFRVAK